ncbi:uncharacterized protein K460DRAFT_244482, partial [Cucurbitaria berberidis CBS 394.84]
VQNMLDAAQLEVGRRYAAAPDLCEMLQSQVMEGLEQCNLQEVDPMQVLHDQMRIEWRILDAYNKHRLGKATHRYYNGFSEPEGGDNYKKEDNIPEEPQWFPLRCEVQKYGFRVVAPPIYQVSSTDKELSARPESTVNRFTKTKALPGNAANSGNDTSSPKKKKTGRAAANYDKLADAPSAHLDFPDGNITLAEMTAFLPQSIKSWDVIDRALFNGAFSATLAGMINHFRNMPAGNIENNSVYRMMKAPMDKRALTDPVYEGWSVSVHQKIQKPIGFNPASVSVAGFRTPSNNYKRDATNISQESAQNILFRDLMKGVKVMPSGYDALDLTRCVQYCVDHPEEDWLYPQDFVDLVSQLPQDAHLSRYPRGPAPVQLDHQDASIVGRYTSTKKLNGAMYAASRQRDSNGRLLKKQKADSDEEE